MYAKKLHKVKLLEEEIVRMRNDGKMSREVAEHYGLGTEQIKELLKRRNAFRWHRLFVYPLIA